MRLSGNTISRPPADIIVKSCGAISTRHPLDHAQAVKNALHIARPLTESAAAAAADVAAATAATADVASSTADLAVSAADVAAAEVAPSEGVDVIAASHGAHPTVPSSDSMEVNGGDVADVPAAADVAAADVAAEGLDEEETAGGILSAAGLMRRIARLAGDECV